MVKAKSSRFVKLKPAFPFSALLLLKLLAHMGAIPLILRTISVTLHLICPNLVSLHRAMFSERLIISSFT